MRIFKTGDTVYFWMVSEDCYWEGTLERVEQPGTRTTLFYIKIPAGETFQRFDYDVITQAEYDLITATGGAL